MLSWYVIVSFSIVAYDGIHCLCQTISRNPVFVSIIHSWSSMMHPGQCSVVMLAHWGRVTHICISKLTTIGSDNGLSPGRRQAIIWTNAGILLIKPLGINFNETSIEIHTFSFKKIHLKLSSGKWRPFCLSLNVLNYLHGSSNCF